MSTLTINELVIPNFQSAGPVTLRVYYERSFVASDSTLVRSGAIGSSEWFVAVDCTVDTDAHTLTVPAFDLITTDDPLPAGSINSVATGIFYSNDTQLDTLFSQFTIPASLAPTANYSVLAIFNTAVTLTYPSSSYLTREQVIALIQEMT